MRRPCLTSLAAAAFAAAALAVAAPAALAHVSISKTGPARSATITHSPNRAWVLFSGPIRRGTLRVYRVSTGALVSSGSGGRDPRNINRVLTSINGRLKNGKYRVVWTCIAGDGHHQTGHYLFRLKR